LSYRTFSFPLQGCRAIAEALRGGCTHILRYLHAGSAYLSFLLQEVRAVDQAMWTSASAADEDSVLGAVHLGPDDVATRLVLLAGRSSHLHSLTTRAVDALRDALLPAMPSSGFSLAASVFTQFSRAIAVSSCVNGDGCDT
jgi:hypothetical protein